MTEFFTKTIEEITETLIDYRGKTPPKSSSGIKLITAKVIKDGFVQDGSHEYISENTYATWMRRGLPQQRDILITTEAPLGEVAQLRTPEKIALAQRVILLRGDSSVIDQQYYFQALKSPFVQAQLRARATGTTVFGIKQSELRQVEIPCYPLPTQRKIAAVLSAYDDLIENNTRRIAILEEMAQALYREWFVHFRFPGHEQVAMVDSEVGLIPEGWEVTSILDVPYFRFVRENVRSYEGTKRYFATADIRGIEIVGEGIEYAYEDKPSRAQKKPVINSVWFARMKDTYKVLPFTAVNERLAASSLLSSGFAGFEATNPNTFGFLFFTIDSDEFHERKDLYCTGATQMSLTNEGLGRIELVVPDESTVTAFGQIAQPMVDQILILQARNSVLRRTRDLLLPRLISGEVDVSEQLIDTGGLDV